MDLFVEPHNHLALSLLECLSQYMYLSVDLYLMLDQKPVTSGDTAFPPFLTHLSHSCLLHVTDTELCAVPWRVQAILLLALCTNSSLDQSDHPYTSPPPSGSNQKTPIQSLEPTFNICCISRLDWLFSWFQNTSLCLSLLTYITMHMEVDYNAEELI